nr:GNAT family N-acetyltransferase [Mesorhizobium sp.]
MAQPTQRQPHWDLCWRVRIGGTDWAARRREVLRYAFETLALEQVTAQAAARNFASLRILAKLGFKHIDSFIDEFDGERCERFALDGDIGSSLLASNAMPGC